MNEENILIVRAGEASLKGQNKPYFEKMLAERIKKLLRKFEGINVKRSEGLIFIRSEKHISQEDIIHEVKKVFGITSISPAVECNSNIEDIEKTAIKYMKDLIEKKGIKTFKVESKRADKSFPLISPEISKRVGGAVLKGCKVLKVDVHDPDCRLFVNVRRDITYLYQQRIKGFGGLPLGTKERRHVVRLQQ